MARPRSVVCGEHEFTTRANPRVLVSCPTCGVKHRAPAIEDPWPGPGRPAASEGAAPPPPPDEAAPASTPGGLRKQKAAGVKAKRTSAKPRPAPADRPDDTLTKAQQAGRRGGLSQGTLRRMGRR